MASFGKNFDKHAAISSHFSPVELSDIRRGVTLSAVQGLLRLIFLPFVDRLVAMRAMWRSGLFLADNQFGFIVAMDSYEAEMLIALTGLKLNSGGAAHISDVIQKTLTAIIMVIVILPVYLVRDQADIL